MSDNEPKPAFFDRAWWQQFTSNALGSAVGTGITALVGLFAAVTSGIVQLPQGPSRLVGVLFGLLFGGFFVFVGIAMLYSARIHGDRRRFNLVFGILILVMSVVIAIMLITPALTQFPYR